LSFPDCSSLKERERKGESWREKHIPKKGFARVDGGNAVLCHKLNYFFRFSGICRKNQSYRQVGNELASGKQVCLK